jgi:tetratricopeptide (TPR) repeat protein
VRLTKSDLRAGRELLRHLHHAHRLRANRIVARMLRAAGRDAVELSDAALVAYVTEAAEAAIERLPARQRAIVRRCDMGGERYADVARLLFISERHAFRERDAAVAHMFEHLIAARPGASSGGGEDVDRFWLQVSNAQALEHNGRWQTAAAVLGQLGREVADPDRRCFVETRLARLYEQAEQVARAEAHLTSACELAANSPTHIGWQEAEVGVTAAWLAAARGETCAADRLVRRCCAELESWSQTTNDPRVRNALIDGLTLQVDLAVGRGDLEACTMLASRACELAGDAQGLDLQVVISARSISASVGFLRGRDAQATRADLEQSYVLATKAGLTREALVVSTHVAGCMRLARRPAEAARLLRPLVPAAKTVAVGGAAIGFFCELASSSLESLDTAAAARYLTELQARSLRNPLAQASVDLITAKTRLAQRDYAAALEAAEAAEMGFRRLGQDRIVGTSLRLQAEALARLGQRERALTNIKLAIEALAGRSHPTRLAAAYRVLASLSGEAKYAAAARRLCHPSTSSGQDQDDA